MTDTVMNPGTRALGVMSRPKYLLTNRWFGIWRVVLLVILSAAPLTALPIQEDKAKVMFEKLENGLALVAEASEVDKRNGLKQLTEALAWFQETNDRRSAARALEHMGLARKKLDEKSRAIEDLELALTHYMALNDATALQRVASPLANLYWGSGDRSKNLALFDRLQDHYRSHNDFLNEGYALEKKVESLSNYGHLEKAQIVLAKIYDIAKSNNSSALLLTARKVEVALHIKNGNYRESLAVIKDMLADQEGPFEPEMHATVYNAGGASYRNLGEPYRALEWLGRVNEQSVPKIQTAISLYNMAEIYHTFGDRHRALQLYRQTLDLFREMDDTNGTASVMDRLGLVMMQMGDLDGALDFLTRSHGLFSRLKNVKGQAYTLTHIGNNYQHRGDLETALSFHHQALQHADPERSSWHTVILHSLGMTHHLLGSYSEAECYFREALAMQRARGVQSESAETLKHLALIYLDMKNYAKASYHLDLAMEQFQATENRQGIAQTLHVAARIAVAEGRINVAIALNEDALSIIESLRTKIGGLQLRTSYFEIIHQVYLSGIDTLMLAHNKNNDSNYAAAALQLCERARARTLMEFLNEKPNGQDDDLAGRKSRLQRRLSAKLNYLIELPDTPRNREEREHIRRELDKILADYRVVENQLASAPNSDGKHLDDLAHPLTTHKIQNQVLDTNTLLLEYAFGEEKSYLWCVDQTQISAFELPGMAVIETQAKTFFDLLTARNRKIKFETKTERKRRIACEDKKLAAVGSTLGDMLIGPVAEKLKDQRLLIVGDGVLLHIPFGVLSKPGQKKRRMLMEDHVLVTAPSASVLYQLNQQKREPAEKLLAIFADPVFNSQDPRLGFDRQGPKGERLRQSNRDVMTDLPRLPGTRHEAENLLALAPKSETFLALDFDANRKTVMDSEITDYQMVHFATHGILNTKYPELNGLILSMVDKSGGPIGGVLKQHDITSMKWKADMVVLSACQTALGKRVRGEGLLGLSQSFMYAGVPRVVASLWNIQDEATSELMVRFYHGIIKEEMTPSEALRQAQLSLMKDPKWNAPYYWGGFILQGQW